MKMPWDIFKEIYLLTGVTRAEMRGRRRFVHIVNARKLFAKTAWEEGYSFVRIGKLLNRDHTTIISYKTRGWKQKVNTPRFRVEKPKPTILYVPKNLRVEHGRIAW